MKTASRLHITLFSNLLMELFKTVFALSFIPKTETHHRLATTVAHLNTKEAE